MLLLAERIRFTERCEKALREGRAGLKDLVEYLETQRARYRGLEDTADKLTALKARGLLLDIVHHLEVARNLLSATLQGESTAWTWQRQLRSYRTVGFFSYCSMCCLSRKIKLHYPSLLQVPVGVIMIRFSE